MNCTRIVLRQIDVIAEHRTITLKMSNMDITDKHTLWTFWQVGDEHTWKHTVATDVAMMLRKMLYTV